VWVWNRFFSHRISVKLARVAAAIFIAVFLSHALLMQYNLSKDKSGLWSIPKQNAEAYEWLSKNTPTGSVVASISDKTSRDLSLFTKNISLMPNGFNTLSPNEKIWVSALFAGNLWNMNSAEIKSLISDSAMFLFKEYYRPNTFDSSFKRSAPPVIPQKDLSNFVLNARISEIKPSYVLIGENELRISKKTPSAVLTNKPVFSNGKVNIFSM
jgi:hypothetical protein